MNSQAFTPEEVEKGLLKDFLNMLLTISSKFEDSYYDIHITTDGYCTIVEWVDCFYNQPSDQFKLVKEDQIVMSELMYPDNSCEYVFPEDVDEKLREWHNDHPEWVKTSYGTWTNTVENEKFRQSLLQEDTHDWVIPPHEKNEDGDLVVIDEDDSTDEAYEENGVPQ